MSDSRYKTSVFHPNLFQGCVAIVTGGGTGIGKAITQELLFLGCTVVIASRKLDRLNRAAEEIQSWARKANQGSNVHVVQCNVRKEDEIKRLISTTIDHYGKLDYLINNGGGQFLTSTAEISLKGWQAVVETNLTGTFLLCREAYNQWMKDHGGVIINMAMDMWKGCPVMAHSAAARAGVVNLTKTLGVEWAHSKVRVNCVAPGSSIASPTAIANYGDENIFESVKDTIPMKRLGTVEEGASFITGQTVIIDGGQTLYKSPITLSPDSKPTYSYSWQSRYDGPHSASPKEIKAKL